MKGLVSTLIVLAALIALGWWVTEGRAQSPATTVLSEIVAPVVKKTLRQGKAPPPAAETTSGVPQSVTLRLQTGDIKKTCVCNCVRDP